jgi:formate dehydrogenase beta subunit
MGRLIDALFDLQRREGFLSERRLRDLAEQLDVPLYRLQELLSFYPHFRTTPPKRVHLAVCRDVVCHMRREPEELAGLAALASDEVEVHSVSCLGRCDVAPAVAVNECPVGHADRAAVERAIASPPALEAVHADRPPRRYACDPYGDDEGGRYGVLRDWLAGGAEADEIVGALDDSGLRGMGGAGFPTGRKWAMVRSQPAGKKYVVCNADESEPGTFKDRTVLADLPHLVIEGMIFAGLVVGADEGVIFIRHEYGPECARLERAIEVARERGVLGADAAGSGRAFDIRIAVSPGGYILGEETALLECLEDRRGEPRNKPPFPGERGLFGSPTLINNVETFAYLPAIVSGGGTAWRARGTNDKPGLKLMAVSGDVVTPGVYEVAMGTTLGELIERAGGVVDGRALLAVAPGGASSNFLPASGAAVALDFDDLAKAGSMLGSGAAIVVAEGRDLLALSANLVQFFRNESCGKCVPCRVGSHKAVQLLDEAIAGRASKKHLPLLRELAETLEQTSICGLGQVALNPFISALDRFPEIEPRFGEE